MLTNAENKVVNSGTIALGLSDHELIFCLRKVIKSTSGEGKTISYRSMKNYTKELLLDKLKDVVFPNYENFDDVNLAYSDFVSKCSIIIDKITPLKQSKVKNNSQEWYDHEIAEKIKLRDKKYKIFKKSHSPENEASYKRAKYDAHYLIKRKKKCYISMTI